ncbi:hypothetical protein P3T23_003316 [Paraburkholderia sp. GAS448]|jgi:hypothetical protein|uniref:hypothetical protein n=1 Tax=Paraburkholderia sp. GAS448 TaxID=3035136 RepID=UPI003D21D311
MDIVEFIFAWLSPIFSRRSPDASARYQSKIEKKVIKYSTAPSYVLRRFRGFDRQKLLSSQLRIAGVRDRPARAQARREA